MKLKPLTIGETIAMPVLLREANVSLDAVDDIMANPTFGGAFNNWASKVPDLEVGLPAQIIVEADGSASRVSSTCRLHQAKRLPQSHGCRSLVTVCVYKADESRAIRG